MAASAKLRVITEIFITYTDQLSEAKYQFKSLSAVCDVYNVKPSVIRIVKISNSCLHA